MENIKIKIREFIGKKNKKKTFEDSDDLFKLGFVDSLFALQLVMFVEKEFKIKVSNKEINEDNFRSVDAIAETVSRIIG